MKLLIETIPGDEHAHAIKWLMEQRLHEVTLFTLADYPAQKLLSLHLSTAKHILSGFNTVFDCIVSRRRRDPCISEELCEEDKNYAIREASVVTEALADFIPNQGFWINPPISNRRANNKILQLQRAARVGLTIPNTLVSNDYTEIQKFFTKEEQIIFKSFYPAAWCNDEDQYLSYTTTISSDQLENHQDNLQYAPGIFQQQIDKSYEVRAVVMGRTCRAAKLVDEQGKASLDWRMNYMDGRGLKLFPVVLPTEIYTKCILLMQELGIIFGSRCPTSRVYHFLSAQR